MSRPPNAVSVVIPALDEADTLPALLRDLAGQRGVNMDIIVADGGSRDATVMGSRTAGARVVTAARGRALQMNAGAAAARHAWLLFLHADSRFTATTQIADALAQLIAMDDTYVAGHFALQFERQRAGAGLFYRYLEEKSASGRAYTINGDQGLLLRRDFFDELGGFDTRLPFLEDQRLATAIAARGRWTLLPHRLISSARRFETEGPAARYMLMAIIMAMHVSNLTLFFERAPAVYGQQADTRRLRVAPYFRLLWRLMAEIGPRASLRYWWRVAGFALDQSWQMFFLIDVVLRQRLGSGRYPATAFHDRVFAPAVHHRLGQAIALPIVFVFSMVFCAAGFAWRERVDLKESG